MGSEYVMLCLCALFWVHCYATPEQRMCEASLCPVTWAGTSTQMWGAKRNSASPQPWGSLSVAVPKLCQFVCVELRACQYLLSGVCAFLQCVLQACLKLCVTVCSLSSLCLCRQKVKCMHLCVCYCCLSFLSPRFGFCKPSLLPTQLIAHLDLGGPRVTSSAGKNREDRQATLPTLRARSQLTV